MDTGESKCVIGRKQARIYYTAARIPYQLTPLRTRFRFGNETQPSLGTIPVRILTPISSMIFREVDVVAVDVPVLLVLDFMDEAGIFSATLSMHCNRSVCIQLPVVCKQDGCSEKLNCKSGHLLWDGNRN